MISLISSKRGISLMLEAFIGFVLAVFAVTIIVYVGAQLMTLFYSSSIDPATEANFNNLAKTINTLTGKEKDVIRNFPFHIGEKYIIAGFSRNQGVIDECQGEVLQHPIQCNDKACICIYNSIDKPPMRCLNLPEVEILYSPYYKDELRMQPHSNVATGVAENLVAAPLNFQLKTYGGYPGNYQYFILYGKCHILNAFGVQNLYIDIHTENNKKYLFIAGESSYTHDRYNDLQQELAGYPGTIDKSLEDIINLIKQNKNPYDTRDAIFTVLSSKSMIDKFLATHTVDELKELLFKRYEPPQFPVSVSEEKITKNAKRVWEQYFNILILFGYPMESLYISSCVAAYKTANPNNECWVPKHIDLNV